MARSAGYASKLGWSVGIHSWLDKEESKVERYWRVIEFGSAATRWPWQGQRIVGLWSNSVASKEGALDPFVQGRGNQKFVPFSKLGATGPSLDRSGRAALWVLTRGGKDLSMLTPTRNTETPRGPENERKRIFYWLMNKATIEQMPFVSGVIVRAVPPGNFYLRAMANFNPMQTQLDVLRSEVNALLGGRDIKSTGGLRAARELLADDSIGGRPRTGPRRTEGVSLAGMQRMYGLPQKPMISIKASAIVQDFIRDGSGRFSAGAWADMVISVNRRVAEAFQAEVAQLMRQERKRPPTGNLIKATESSNNRFPR